MPYILPNVLRGQIAEVLASHLNSATPPTPTVAASSQLAQMATGADYLSKLAQNIADLAVGNPPTYPDIVFGAYGV